MAAPWRRAERMGRSNSGRFPLHKSPRSDLPRIRALLALAFAPDGTLVVCEDTQLAFWDVEACREIRPRVQYPAKIFLPSLSPDVRDPGRRRLRLRETWAAIPRPPASEWRNFPGRRILTRATRESTSFSRDGRVLITAWNTLIGIRECRPGPSRGSSVPQSAVLDRPVSGCQPWRWGSVRAEWPCWTSRLANGERCSAAKPTPSRSTVSVSRPTERSWPQAAWTTSFAYGIRPPANCSRPWSDTAPRSWRWRFRPMAGRWPARRRSKQCAVARRIGSRTAGPGKPLENRRPRLFTGRHDPGRRHMGAGPSRRLPLARQVSARARRSAEKRPSESAPPGKEESQAKPKSEKS